MMEPYHYISGNTPIIISIPHAGTYIPPNILERLSISAQQLPDTDWHVEKLYAFAKEFGAHILIATHSRYVIDLNRSTDGQSLYPGKFTTELCPLSQFDGKPVYSFGMEPDAEEIKKRITSFWQPYHVQLQSLIKELKKHNRIILFDAHSIRSQVPLLFEGILPDLNLGTADGNSANPQLIQKLIEHCDNKPYSFVCNGRFKGGYITRHYGNPKEGIDAIQLEIAQHNYMQEGFPYSYEEKKAKKLQELLYGLFQILHANSTDNCHIE